MTKTIEDKVLKLKALLGDDAAKQALAELERREQAAQEAGLDFKEADDKKVGTKADKPVSLTEILAEIDAGLEAGEIENDLEAEGEEGDAETLVEPEAVKEMVKEAVSELLDQKLDALVTKLGLTEQKNKEAENRRLKELQEAVKSAQAEIDALQGDQPKKTPYRASQAEDSVRSKGVADEGPHPDPVGTFVNDFILGSNGRAADQP